MRLIDIFTEYSGRDSIFQKMVSLGAPWTQEIGLDMDIMYFTAYSGFKKATMFVEMNLDNGVPDSLLISRLIYTMNSVNWKHLWNAYSAEYSPLENYDMTEKIVRAGKKEESRDLSSELRERNTSIYTTSQKGMTNTTDIGKSESDRTDSGTSTETVEYGHTVTTNDTTVNSVYGFNSTAAVPSSETTGTQTQTNGGTDTTSTSNSLTSHNAANDDRTLSTDDFQESKRHGDEERKSVTIDGGSVSVKDSEDITTQRSGNIGVTTSQQLLLSEIGLWKWNFYRAVFDAVDSYLALSIFDMSEKYKL